MRTNPTDEEKLARNILNYLYEANSFKCCDKPDIQNEDLDIGFEVVQANIDDKEMSFIRKNDTTNVSVAKEGTYDDVLQRIYDLIKEKNNKLDNYKKFKENNLFIFADRIYYDAEKKLFKNIKKMRTNNECRFNKIFLCPFSKIITKEGKKVLPMKEFLSFNDAMFYLLKNHFIYIFDIDNEKDSKKEIIDFNNVLKNDFMIKTANDVYLSKEDSKYRLDFNDIVIESNSFNNISPFLKVKIYAIQLGYQIIFLTSEVYKICKNLKSLYSLDFIIDDSKKVIFVKGNFSPNILIEKN